MVCDPTVIFTAFKPIAKMAAITLGGAVLCRKGMSLIPTTTTTTSTNTSSTSARMITFPVLCLQESYQQKPRGLTLES